MRRWLADSNPALAEVLDEYAGPEWATDMDVLRNLENHIDDKLLEKIDATKLIGKHKLLSFRSLIRYVFLRCDASWWISGICFNYMLVFQQITYASVPHAQLLGYW